MGWFDKKPCGPHNKVCPCGDTFHACMFCTPEDLAQAFCSEDHSKWYTSGGNCIECNNYKVGDGCYYLEEDWTSPTANRQLICRECLNKVVNWVQQARRIST